LSSGSGEYLCSPPAILLWSLFFTVFVYWELVSLLAPFLWGKVRNPLASSLLSACYGLLIIFLIFQHHLTLNVGD
jgi:hypothetical protein